MYLNYHQTGTSALIDVIIALLLSFSQRSIRGTHIISHSSDMWEGIYFHQMFYTDDTLFCPMHDSHIRSQVATQLKAEL